MRMIVLVFLSLLITGCKGTVAVRRDKTGDIYDVPAKEAEELVASGWYTYEKPSNSQHGRAEDIYIAISQIWNKWRGNVPHRIVCVTSSGSVAYTGISAGKVNKHNNYLSFILHPFFTEDDSEENSGENITVSVPIGGHCSVKVWVVAAD